jgi:hypothetical protein
LRDRSFSATGKTAALRARDDAQADAELSEAARLRAHHELARKVLAMPLTEGLPPTVPRQGQKTMTPKHPEDEEDTAIGHVRVSTMSKNGELVHAEDDEAKRKFDEWRARSGRAAERRRALWGEGGEAAMSKLCKLFPSLARVSGSDPFDATKLLRFACSGHSHGEVLAAKFVLSVWNSTADWNAIAHEEGILEEDERLRPFDLFEAWGTWDEGHREAALTWLKDPFWP